jgi:hypothetical protein
VRYSHLTYNSVLSSHDRYSFVLSLHFNEVERRQLKKYPTAYAKRSLQQFRTIRYPSRRVSDGEKPIEFIEESSEDKKS